MLVVGDCQRRISQLHEHATTAISGLRTGEIPTAAKEQKLNRITSDRTAADSEQKDEDLFVSQHSSKPNVRRSIKCQT